MSSISLAMRRLYTSALEAHLRQTGEKALHQAYELGRQALGEGVGVLDLTLLHHDALEHCLIEHDTDEDSAWLELAAEFLAECLSPFEMTLRGYREANARLSAANSELTRTSEALAAAHTELRTEIEERRKAEDALVHAKKLQAIGLLAGGVAHHFNNLLTVVLGNVALARRRLTGDALAERYLDAARHGAERGAEVTRQLLSFSRQQVLRSTVVDPAAWVVEIAPLLSSTLRGDIRVQTAVIGRPPSIKVDLSELELAILNLAVNARDAMPNGGTLTITVSDRRIEDGRLGLAGDFVVIEIADTGEGVPPEILARVFEPFFTTKQGGPGAGLGLSQAHGFTHQSGGGIELDSPPGQGTAVRLYLPTTDAEPVAAAETAPAASTAVASGCILVVEDEAAVAELACDLLQSLGYSVKLAAKAQAALDLLDSGEPVHLVFSDVVLSGGMNGLQLAKEVRRRFPKLPILLTSGYNDAIEQADAKVLALIHKPYATDELGRRIAELLAQRKA